MASQKREQSFILVVDDDHRIRQMLASYFEAEGFRVETADGGAQMRMAIAKSRPDVILLDLVMPGEDGLSLAREVRASSDIPIIMLTGRCDVVDRIVGLEVGADDYITKPFHLREVLARIRTVLRRAQPAVASSDAAAGGEIREFEGWRIDFTRRELLSPAGERVALSTGEFDLLTVFVNHPNQVLDRDRLMDLLKGQEWSAFDRSIDTQVSRLRKKIEADPAQPRLIKSVRGVGYVLASKVSRV